MMPSTKKQIHFCQKCGKQMEYKEKSMLYIYDVVRKRSKYSKVYMPQKRYAINLCKECSREAEELVKEWIERANV